MKKTKLTVENISKLFDVYGIKTLEDLQKVLHFTSYYKIENLELRKKLGEALALKQPKFVIVENPKLKKKTIMIKERKVTDIYRACEATKYSGYFKERTDLGEFDTLEDAKRKLKEVK